MKKTIVPSEQCQTSEQTRPQETNSQSTINEIAQRIPTQRFCQAALLPSADYRTPGGEKRSCRILTLQMLPVGYIVTLP
jgi:hypothetical protein